MSVLSRVLRPFVFVSALLAACSSGNGARVTITEGPFSIKRTEHSYSNWNTGGRTKYYNYRVLYRKKKFSFIARDADAIDVRDKEYASSDIARAYVISAAPAALIVLSGDPNNNAVWILLIDTPNGLRSEHIASYSGMSQFAWLDDSAPKLIERLRDQMRLTDGRWLWIENQTLLDRETLSVYPLQTIPGARSDAQFVAFSPDRQHMARFASVFRYEDQSSQLFILNNNITTGVATSHPIDPRTMWLDSNLDVDASYLDAYFEWQSQSNSFVLQPRATPKNRPYQGRMSRRDEKHALQFHVPRLQYAYRTQVMELLAQSLSGQFTFDESTSATPIEPPPASDVDSNDASVASNAGVVPLSIETDRLVRADLHIGNRMLSIYFSDKGLSLENASPAQDDLVLKVANIVNAHLLTREGKIWVAMH